MFLFRSATDGAGAVGHVHPRGREDDFMKMASAAGLH